MNDNFLDHTDAKQLRSSTSSADLIKVKCEDNNESRHKRKNKSAFKQQKKSSFVVKQSNIQFNSSPMKTIKVKPGDSGLQNKVAAQPISAQSI